MTECNDRLLLRVSDNGQEDWFAEEGLWMVKLVGDEDRVLHLD